MAIPEIIISAASLSLLFLSFYILLKKRTASNIFLSVLLVVLALTEFSDQYALYHARDPLPWKHASILLESFLPCILLLLGITYGRQTLIMSIPLVWRLITASALLFPVSLFYLSLNDLIYSPDLQTERLLFLGDAGYWFYIGLMLYCVLALINLETTFSATTGPARWRIKFEFIGLVSILSVLIFYFSQGLLYRVINMSLMPIRSGIFIMAAFLIGYSKIFRGNDVKVLVSRYVLYRSLTLIIVGLYLIILGLMGEGMRYLRIPFSRDLTVLFAFASGIALLILLLSEQLRRKVKVVINKHLYKHKHDYREQWLRFTDKLSGCKLQVDVHMAVLSCYIEAFGLTGASLYLFDKGKNAFVNTSQLSMPHGPADFMPSTGLLSYFSERNRILNPYDNEYAINIEESACIRQAEARLIVPLIFDRKVEGLIFIQKQLVDEEFNYEDYDLMKTLAKQAAQSIISYRLAEELVETMEMFAMAKMSSFVIHDIKNLTYSLSLLVNNAEHYMDNPEFQNDMIATLKNSVSKMKNLVQKLKATPEKESLNTILTDVTLLVQEVVGDILKINPDADIHYHGSSSLSLVDREEIRKVILNLVMNALDAVGNRGTVTIETDIYDRTVRLRIKDNGCGITEDYLKNHIFKPFRTTKEQGLGIGLYQCKQIIEAHSGTICAESAAGEGTVLTVSLPVAEFHDYAVTKI
jgi:putative PEP-CTERM system histidine kinase